MRDNKISHSRNLSGPISKPVLKIKLQKNISTLATQFGGALTTRTNLWDKSYLVQHSWHLILEQVQRPSYRLTFRFIKLKQSPEIKCRLKVWKYKQNTLTRNRNIPFNKFIPGDVSLKCVS